MAARENQGYLIAVIILVLLTLVLALLAFLGMSKASEYSEGMAKAQADAKVAEKKSEAHQIEAEILRAYVGDLNENTAEVPTKISSLSRLSNDSVLNETQKSAIQLIVNRVDEVKAAYERDMQQYVARAEEEGSEDLTWSGVVQHLVAVAARKHRELNIQRNQNAKDKADLENEKQALQERLNESTNLLTKATEDLATERKRYKDQEQQMLENLTKAQNTIRDNSKLSDEKIAKLRKIEVNLTAEREDLTKENKNLKMTITDLTRENFDLHDGIIKGVSRDSDLVYINRGRADGLRTNQTFAVYDHVVNNYIKGQEKAKIEIIRITGPKEATARITEQNPIDPITINDKIVTPTWDPGFNVPIALAGFFDMDEDGHSDLRQFVRMVENNGGKIVAQTDENGKIRGKIDSSTRYLVLGGTPKRNPTSEASAALNNAIRELERQAAANTVQILDMRLMLNKMGLHKRSSIDKFYPQTDKSFRSRQNYSQTEGNSAR